MPKLPSNLVKPAPPAFDNPLRRTASTTITEPLNTENTEGTAPESLARVISLPVTPTEPTFAPDAAASAEMTETTTQPATETTTQLNARISVRLDDAVFVALQTECYERRVRGEKTNVAEVARKSLAGGHNVEH
jgi:hypothetical protein